VGVVRVVVVGRVARDLVLEVERLPGAGGSAAVRRRTEVLGGKGANQGLGCAQLGAEVTLLGVVGDDRAGEDVLAQARGDGMDVTGVVRRPGTTTALLTDVLEGDGTRRLLEHVPEGVLLRAADVHAGAGSIGSADAVLVQLQEPTEAVTTALRLAREAGALVVADGAPADDAVRRAVLRDADVVRADATEAPALLGRAVDGAGEAVDAARELVAAGRGRAPRVVALALGSEGDLVVWGDGALVVPLLEPAPVDPTGGGDAFVAGLATALAEGCSPAAAGRRAGASSAAVVRRAGGRPCMDRTSVLAEADAARAAVREPGA
jgi:ribokinase